MPAFPRRSRLVLVGLAAAACLLLLLPWARYAEQSLRSWDITTPWLAGGLLSLAALVLLALPVRYADLLAVVAACLAAVLAVAGLLEMSGLSSDDRLPTAQTVPAATAFFTATSDFTLPRDTLRLADGAALTAGAWTGLCTQLLLAGAALVALRSTAKAD